MYDILAYFKAKPGLYVKVRDLHIGVITKRNRSGIFYYDLTRHNKFFAEHDEYILCNRDAAMLSLHRCKERPELERIREVWEK